MTRWAAELHCPGSWLLAPWPGSRGDGKKPLFVSTARVCEHGLRAGLRVRTLAPSFKSCEILDKSLLLSVPLQIKDKDGTSSQDCVRGKRKPCGARPATEQTQSTLAATMQMAEPESKSLRAWGTHYSQGKPDYF